jgi:Tfp pilus assembly protein PilV
MPRTRESGVSLVEVILALALVGLVLLQAVGALIHTTQSKDTVREYTIARHVAEAEIEKAKSSALSDFEGLAALNDTTAPTNRLTNGLVRYTVATANPKLYDVAVEVTWTGHTAPQRYRSTCMIVKP